MKKRTIVYGLGRIFHENHEKIMKDYNVVGFSDKKPEKIMEWGGVTREYLTAHIDDYDEILVCANPLQIVPDLTGNLGIPYHMIKIYDECKKIHHDNIMNFYGERSEDAVLMLLISTLGFNLADIKYLEIGTNNPITANNSYSLYRAGARGVLTDAVPFFIPLVDCFRSEDQFIQAAITDADENKNTTFYLPIRSDGAREFAIGSLDKNWHTNFNGMSECAIIEVPTLNVNALLKKIGFIPEILLIDIEGYDEKILRAIDYKTYKPMIIMAELGGISKEIRSFMLQNEYEVFAHVGSCNAIFVLKEYWDHRIDRSFVGYENKSQ